MLDWLVSALFGMLLAVSVRIMHVIGNMRSASIPNNIHVTLVMIVEACLAGICAAARMLITEPTTAEETPIYPLLPLTIPEVRHLLAYLLWPPPRSATLLLSWSWWRRCHQSRASFFHTKHRCSAG
jgi:hypothetical protein